MKLSLQSAFILCLERVLRPVAAFCLRRAIKFQDFSEAAKRAFVWAARKELSHTNQKDSALKLSVITGLQRRDISRLVMDNTEQREEQRNLIVRVISRWEQHKKYRRDGHPRPLKVEGKESEFAVLVREISADINPYAVLFELERIKAVERKGDSIYLTRATYEPAQGELLEAFEMLSSDAHDLISSVSENVIEGITPKNLHATTAYDNVDPAQLPHIRSWLLIHGEKFHEEARDFLSKFDRDEAPSGGHKTGARVALGTFSVIEQRRSKR